MHNERDAGEVTFGYADAFYEIASMVGIGAQPHPPKVVWEEQLRPTIALLMSTRPPASEDAGTVERALRKIAAGTQITLENGELYPSPLGARHSQEIAFAALSRLDAEGA